MYNVVDIKGEIQNALKSITVSDLNDSVLSPQQFQKFVDGLQDESKLLSIARLQEMYSHIVKIDRVEFTGRVMQSGTDSNGDKVAPSGSKPAFKTNTLTAKEIIGETGLTDEAVRRNIMKKALESHLISIFSKQAAFDIAEYCLWADTASTDTYLNKTDGWIKRAGNKVYGLESAANAGDQDFDPSDVLATLNAAMLAMPKRAIRDRSKVAFLVPFEIEDALREAYANRGTSLGDIALTENGSLKYKGFPVVYDQALDASDERVVLFTNPNNLVYGVFHQVTIEDDRQPKLRQTDFVLTTEVDADFDNEEAAVVAFLDRNKPAA